MSLWWGSYGSIVCLLMLCGVKFFWYLGFSGWCERRSLLYYLHVWISWETVFKYLEYGTGLSNVVIPQECNTCTFEDIERPLDHLKSLLVGTLFEWSRIWGYMWCISISDFLESVSTSFWCNCFKYSVFIIVNTMYFLLNNTLLPIKKK